MEHHAKSSQNKSHITKFETALTRILQPTKCCFPIENIWFNITVFIVSTDVVILLSSVDMDPLGRLYNSTIDILIHKPSGARATTQREFGHHFLSWSWNLNCFHCIGAQPFALPFRPSNRGYTVRRSHSCSTHRCYLKEPYNTSRNFEDLRSFSV